MKFIKKIKPYRSLLSIVTILAFIIGLCAGIRDILSNRWIQEKMIRLAFTQLQTALDFWVILLIVGSIILLIGIRLAFRLFAGMIPRHMLEIHPKSRNTVSKFVIAVFLFISIGAAGLWMANRRWLPEKTHPLSLTADLIILIAALLIGWLFLKAQWGQRFNIRQTMRILRRTAPVLLIVLILLNAGLFLDKIINPPRGPNVLLIIIDTLRADHLGCYGYDRNTSPNIDKLAENAVRFENAVSSAPWTTPSIASIMTAQYPARMGFRHDPVKIDDRFVTLAEIFKQNNYRTKGIISHTFLSSELKFDQGFDSYDEENARHRAHVSSESITDKAIAYLEKNKTAKHFLFLHYFDPHYDYILHDQYNFTPEYPGCYYSGQSIFDLRACAPCMNRRDIEYVVGLHDSEIAYTDAHIGRLFKKLRELDLFESTLIILTADHGEEFLERGDNWIGHTRKLYQEMIHVPLIIKPPNAEKDIVEDEFGLINLMPLIVNTDDWSLPGEREYEKKIMDFLDHADLKNRPVISETRRGANMQSVILNGWKSICDLRNRTMELYHLDTDPLETHDVYAQNDSLASMMDGLLFDWNQGIDQTAGEKPEFSEEQIKNLRSMGYIK